MIILYQGLKNIASNDSKNTTFFFKNNTNKNNNFHQLQKTPPDLESLLRLRLHLFRILLFTHWKESVSFFVDDESRCMNNKLLHVISQIIHYLDILRKCSTNSSIYKLIHFRSLSLGSCLLLEIDGRFKFGKGKISFCCFSSTFI